MTIYGCGIDIVKNQRIKKILLKNKDHFMKKIFADEEIEYLQKKDFNYKSVAVRFAAKEAFSKAIGSGIGKICSFKDIMILKNSKGKPYIQLSKRVHLTMIQYIKNFKYTIHCSLSHEEEYSIAQVIVEI